jgi:hypothetical protein
MLSSYALTNVNKGTVCDLFIVHQLINNNVTTDIGDHLGTPTHTLEYNRYQLLVCLLVHELTLSPTSSSPNLISSQVFGAAN